MSSKPENPKRPIRFLLFGTLYLFCISFLNLFRISDFEFRICEFLLAKQDAEKALCRLLKKIQRRGAHGP